MLEKLIEWDHSLFLTLNGLHNSFFDFVFYWLSDTLVWIPMYLIFIWLLYKNYPKNWWKILIVLILTIALTDRIGVLAFKEVFQRLRPSHNPEFDGYIHLLNAYKGGQYGFISNHAANTFSLAAFLSFAIGKNYKWFPYIIFSWAALVGYSRIYLGVHYPADVFCGAIVGFSIASLSYYFMRKSRIFRDH